MDSNVIEAMARAAYEVQCGRFDTKWDDISEHTRGNYRKEAQASLRAGLETAGHDRIPPEMIYERLIRAAYGTGQ